jgi:hypothetical protein
MTMISQFFEVQIKERQIDRYLDLAASLKPSLEAMGGCQAGVYASVPYVSRIHTSEWSPAAIDQPHIMIGTFQGEYGVATA